MLRMFEKNGKPISQFHVQLRDKKKKIEQKYFADSMADFFFIER